MRSHHNYLLLLLISDCISYEFVHIVLNPLIWLISDKNISSNLFVQCVFHISSPFDINKMIRFRNYCPETHLWIVIKFFFSLMGSCRLLKICRVLSLFPQLYLGMYPEEHFIEKPVKDAMEKFRKQLAEITSAIKTRNEGKNLPYYNMSPDKIPNSVAVWRVEDTRPPRPDGFLMMQWQSCHTRLNKDKTLTSSWGFFHTY